MSGALAAGPHGLLLPGQIRSQTPSQFVIPNGLVGYWGFDPDCLSGTTAFDLTGNNNGTLTGGATLASGQVGAALVFDGTGYVDLGNPIILQITGNITVSCWFKYTGQWAAGDLNGILVAKDNNTGGRAYTLDISDASTSAPGIRWYENGGASGFVNTGAFQPAINTWHFVVGTIAYNATGGLLTLFIDGIFFTNTTTDTSTPTATANVQIGHRLYAGFTDFFFGTIDDVRIYNRALSRGEIITLHQAGLAGRRDAGQPWLPALFQPAFTMSLQTGLYSLTDENEKLLKGSLGKTQSGTYTLTGEQFKELTAHIVKLGSGYYVLTIESVTVTTSATVINYNLQPMLLGQSATSQISGEL